MKEGGRAHLEQFVASGSLWEGLEQEGVHLSGGVISRTGLWISPASGWSKSDQDYRSFTQVAIVVSHRHYRSFTQVPPQQKIY
jgi:hypothetical protein